MDTPPTTIWADILHSPPAWIAAIGAFIKWVVSPALTSYTRKELDTELKLLAMVPLIAERQERFEQTFSGVPEALARIEGQLQELKRGR